MSRIPPSSNLTGVFTPASPRPAEASPASAPDPAQSALPAAPTGIADAQGKPRFGAYAGSLEEIRRDALKGAYAPDLGDDPLRVKKWVFTSIFAKTSEGKDVAIVTTIGDLGYASMGFMSVYDLSSNRTLASRNFTSLPGLARVGNRPAEGLKASLHTPGGHFTAERAKGDSKYRVTASLSARKGEPEVELFASLNAGDSTPLSVIAPIGARAVNVTQKAQAMSGTGTLRLGDKVVELHDLHGAMDYTLGERKRNTAWLWASSAGRLTDGRRFGLNLTTLPPGEDDSVSENALWVGKQLIPLPKVKFEHGDPMKPWRVTTDEPNARYWVDLTFTPRPGLVHANDTNLLGLVKSQYVQPMGTWSGVIRDGETGRKFVLSNQYGVAEDQNVKW